MSKVHEEITTKGLALPNVILEQLGWARGTKVTIEAVDKTIVIKPREVTEYEIARSARTFLLWEVGDATAIKKPEREHDKWRVTVMLPHRKKDLGQLTYALDGTLVPQESSTPEQLKARANEG